MPIQVDWDDDTRTAIRYEITSPWTWAELHEANIQAAALAATSPQRYVTIIDVSKASIVPSGSFFTQSREATAQKPPNSHITILVVGASGIVQALSNAYVRLYGKRTGTNAVFLGTLEQARLQVEKLLAADEG